MSLKIPVSCVSDDFSFYCVVCFLIFYIFCHWTNQIFSMMILKNLILTPYPLVCTIFVVFLCVLVITLVVLVFWVLTFLHQQESSPKVIFLRLALSYQQESSPNLVDSLKCLALKFLILFPNLKNSFIVIVVVRLCLAHSNRCSFTKNIIRRAPMVTIRRPSESDIGGTETTAFVQCINGRYPQINKL